MTLDQAVVTRCAVATWPFWVAKVFSSWVAKVFSSWVAKVFSSWVAYLVSSSLTCQREYF